VNTSTDRAVTIGQTGSCPISWCTEDHSERAHHAEMVELFRRVLDHDGLSEGLRTRLEQGLAWSIEEAAAAS
jgi:hypothetical protein